METLNVSLSEFNLRSGSVLLKHSETTLTRGLEPGEVVLLQTGERFFYATVADITFEIDDTHHRLTIGPEISESEAVEVRRAAATEADAAPGRVDTAELLYLLRRVRAAHEQTASRTRRLRANGRR